MCSKTRGISGNAYVFNCQNKHSACEAATYLLKLHTGEQLTLTNPLSTIRKGCTVHWQVLSTLAYMLNRMYRRARYWDWESVGNGQMEQPIFDRTGTEKSGPPLNLGQFFRNFLGWTKPVHSDLDSRNFRKFGLIGSHPLIKTEWSDSAVPESLI